MHVGRITALDLVLGLSRLVLGVFALVWMFSLPGELPMVSPVTFWVLVTLYVIYSLLVAGLVQENPTRAEAVFAASAFMDLAFATFIVGLSGGQTSLFCLMFVFFAAIHAFHLGLGWGLVIGLCSSVLCFIAILWDEGGPIRPIRVSFLLVMPVVAAFCAGVSRVRQDARVRLEATQTVGDDDLSPALSRRIFALHVLTSGEGSFTRRADLVSGLLDAVMSPMGLSAYACLLADEDGTAFRCIARHGDVSDVGPELLAPDGGAIMACPEPSVHAGGEGLGAELFEFADDERGTWACVPIRVGGEAIGALLAASPDDISPQTLEVLIAAADLVAVDVDRA